MLEKSFLVKLYLEAPGFPLEFIQRLPDGRQVSRAGMTVKKFRLKRPGIPAFAGMTVELRIENCFIWPYSSFINP